MPPTSECKQIWMQTMYQHGQKVVPLMVKTVRCFVRPTTGPKETDRNTICLNFKLVFQSILFRYAVPLVDFTLQIFYKDTAALWLRSDAEHRNFCRKVMVEVLRTSVPKYQTTYGNGELSSKIGYERIFMEPKILRFFIIFT